MAANVGKTVWMRSLLKHQIEEEKAVHVDADVISDFRETLLTDPLASSLCPPQALDLVAIPVTMPAMPLCRICLTTLIFMWLESGWNWLFLFLSFPWWYSLLCYLDLCLTQNPMGNACPGSLFLVCHVENFPDHTQ